MGLNESMRRAGWRECPDDDVWESWQLKGGIWQTVFPKDAKPDNLSIIFAAWRPVNPETWNYDPRGWGEQSAPVVPDKPDDNGGAWWYHCNNGSTLLCYISSAIVSIIESRDIPSYEGDRIELSRMQQTYRGQWIGPCTKPEASNGKP